VRLFDGPDFHSILFLPAASMASHSGLLC
jgi:hypothetical protein